MRKRLVIYTHTQTHTHRDTHIHRHRHKQKKGGGESKKMVVSFTKLLNLTNTPSHQAVRSSTNPHIKQCGDEHP
jgi:hypothetical protein